MDGRSKRPSTPRLGGCFWNERGRPSRTAPPRQQTLRATVDWSYELLADPERRLFERLAVFAGGWTLAAAEAVCSGEGLEPGDVLDLLGQLVDRSLVVVDTTAAGPVRYRLLDTLRQYAQERLAAGGAAQSTTRRHAAYYLALAERAEPELWRAEMPAWRERLEREHDNLRAALHWAVQHGEAETAYRLGTVLGTAWAWSAHVTEARQWLERILALEDASTGSVLRARVLVTAGTLAVGQADTQAAQTLVAQALQLEAILAGDARYHAGLFYERAWLAQRAGELATARSLLARGAALAEGVGAADVQATCLQQLAQVHLSEGDAGSARSRASEALALAEAVGFVQGRGMALLTLGMVSLQLGDLAAARERFEASLVAGRELGRGAWWVIYVLVSLAQVAIAQGEYGAARAALRESLGRWQDLGNRTTLARLISACAQLAAAEGRVDHARRLAEAAEQLRMPPAQPGTLPRLDGVLDIALQGLAATADRVGSA
jgi:tetratricopeptide (TPR) repeat protein